MKVIFLDIDGVLITSESCRKGDDVLDPNCVAALNKLIERSGAHIVFSSSWRLGRKLDEIRWLLSKWGVKGRVIGRTGATKRIRGLEIGEWIAYYEEHREKLESYVIVDDDRDMGALLGRLVRIDFEKGFCEQHIERAINILNRPLKSD